MRRLCVLLVGIMILCTGSAFAQDSIPDLKGKWNVKASEFHVKGKGFLGKGTVAFWNISEQQGRNIHGTVEWYVKGKEHKGSDGFSGVISKDNKRVYIAGHNEGFRILEIEGPDTMTNYFVVPGGTQPRAGFAELERVK